MADSDLKNKTAKGLLWGGIGSGGMQLLNLAFGILLSRILTPGDYGVIGALAIFSAVAGIFTESGFTLAIVNRKTVDRTDYSSVFWFNLVVGAILYVALFFLAVPISKFYRSPEMVPLARFLFLSFFIGALGTAPSGYLLRNLMIKQRSKCMIIAVAVSGSVGVACALGGLAYWGIAVQTVTYSLTFTVLLWHYASFRPSADFSAKTITDMLPFSVKQMVVALFSQFNNNFFAALLGRFYGMTATGYYTQGNKWTSMGYSTLSSMINSVAQPVIRQTVDDCERLRRVFRKMLRFTVFVSFPAMLGLAIVAEELITITVTAKWLPSVAIMQILCVGGAFMPVATLYGNLFNSINRPGIYMWNNIAIGLAQIVAMLLTYSYGLPTMLVTYVTVNISWLAVWQYFARRTVGLRFREVLADTFPYLGASVAVMAATLAATHAITDVYLSLIAKIALAATLYCLLMWATRSVIFRETLQFIVQKTKRNDTARPHDDNPS